jgi:hypothetical protein
LSGLDNCPGFCAEQNAVKPNNNMDTNAILIRFITSPPPGLIDQPGSRIEQTIA